MRKSNSVLSAGILLSTQTSPLLYRVVEARFLPVMGRVDAEIATVDEAARIVDLWGSFAPESRWLECLLTARFK